ncbi:MAG: hypothetical protein EBR82_77180, partial [Caulobacteraceae bacterium]|nr:hypothetical protein [Caulobacteraceae bacterium]
MVAPNTQDYWHLNFNSGDQLYFLTGENGATNQNLITSSAVFRDTSAWYHFVYTFDFGNATTSERIRFYVNGERITMSGTIAAQGYTGTRFNRASYEHRIGSRQDANSFSNIYLADIHFIDGQALTPSSFGETDATTGVWNPKAYTGTYGTNGFHLEFADNSAATATTLGKDTSGISPANNWTPVNLSTTTGGPTSVA